MSLRRLVRLHFVSGGGHRTAEAAVGSTLLEVAQRAKLDVEGACGGQCACATCHMIMTKEVFGKLPRAKDDEMDMLDLAAEVEETSRLGCQVRVEEFMHNTEIKLPSTVINQLD